MNGWTNNFNNIKNKFDEDEQQHKNTKLKQTDSLMSWIDRKLLSLTCFINVLLQSVSLKILHNEKTTSFSFNRKFLYIFASIFTVQ